MKAEELFSLSSSFPFESHFSHEATPWSWVTAIQSVFSSADFEPQQPDPASLPPGVVIDGAVHIDPSAILHPNIVIQGPAYIGAGTEIRPRAVIRANVIVGEGWVLGNSCEF